jgi:hypothetical protein
MGYPLRVLEKNQPGMSKVHELEGQVGSSRGRVVQAIPRLFCLEIEATSRFSKEVLAL